jgi:SOS-response transcriptional repressor LexA
MSPESTRHRESAIDWELVAQMTPEEFGRFLRSLRERAGLSQREMAERAKIHPAYISFVETGRRNLRKMNAQRTFSILSAYGLREDEINTLFRLWAETEARQRSQALDLENLPPEAQELRPYRLPLVEAGAGSPSFNDAQEYVTLYLPEMRGKGPGDLFAVKVVGNSMEPLLYEGDLAVVHTQGRVGIGAMVAVGIPGDGIVIKKLAEREGKLYLSNVNPMYEDQPFPEDAKIWGPVIAIIRNLTNGYPGRRKL